MTQTHNNPDEKSREELDSVENQVADNEVTSSEETAGEDTQNDVTTSENSVEETCEGDDKTDSCDTASSDSDGEDASADSTCDVEEPEEDPQAVIGKLGDDLAMARADLYNLKKEYSNYVKRAKEAAPHYRGQGQREVIEALVSVLDDIYAAREAGDLQDGPFAAIADKLERTLNTQFKLERYGVAGDLFDPQIHDAMMAQESADVEEPVIAQVIQPGYRIGETTVRATKVIVTNPQS